MCSHYTSSGNKADVFIKPEDKKYVAAGRKKTWKILREM